MSSVSDRDDICQEVICGILRERFVVAKETIRLFGREFVVCLVIDLDGEFSLRCSCNGGIVYVSVGDDAVPLQRREWKRMQHTAEIAAAWIDGYVTGYRQ